MRLVLLEFQTDVEAYFPEPGDVVLSFNPRVRAALAREGVEAKSTAEFFGAEDHREASAWLDRLFKGLEEGWSLPGFQGPETRAAGRTFVYYARLPLSYLFWATRVLDRAAAKHAPSAILVSKPSDDASGSHRVRPGDDWLGFVARAWGEAKGIPVQLIDGIPIPEDPVRREPGFLDRLAGGLALSSARALAGSDALLIASKDHGMGRAVSRGVFGARRPRVLLLGFQRGGLSELLLALVSRIATALGVDISWKGSPKVRAFVSMPALAAAASVESVSDASWRAKLEAWLSDKRVALNVHGVDFAPMVRRKIEEGLFPYMRDVAERGRGLRSLLGALRPGRVVSPFTLDAYDALGALCRESGVDGLSISHGSHVPPGDEAAATEFRYHALGLIDSEWPRYAVQTPWAERFADQAALKGAPVRTGPVLWGLPSGDKVRGGAVRTIVHAGTPRPRHSIRFHIYETSDEYLAALEALAEEVRSMPDTRLVVRFRPNDDVRREELETLLKPDDSVVLSDQGSFADVLRSADALVSFSSTTIEEALQNRVPVVLFGGEGRYRHLPEGRGVHHAGGSRPLRAALEAALSDATEDWSHHVLPAAAREELADAR